MTTKRGLQKRRVLGDIKYPTESMGNNEKWSLALGIRKAIEDL
jgi:hypothetical protein